jgi:hypothetical protein
MNNLIEFAVNLLALSTVVVILSGLYLVLGGYYSDGHLTAWEVVWLH